MGFAGDLQDKLALLCRWTKDQQFRPVVNVARSEGTVRRPELSDIAVTLRTLFPIVVGEFRPGMAACGRPGTRHGQARQPRDDDHFGSRPHLHLRRAGRHRDWDQRLDGRTPLAPIQYYAASLSGSSALTAPMEDGKLRSRHALRLGNAGPIASTLATFGVTRTRTPGPGNMA
jgi:hypothetical protein